MPAPILTSEPQSLTAGTSVQWTRGFPAYPPGTYVLKYGLQASGKSLITITATAAGDLFAVNLDPTTTGNYAPGVYSWAAYVEAGGGREVVARGSISILPSPLAALGDSHAARTLRLIEAAIEGRIPNGLETTNIDGQEIARIPIEKLLDLRDRYRREVLAEAAAARVALGLKNKRNTIGLRFVRPR